MGMDTLGVEVRFFMVFLTSLLNEKKGTRRMVGIGKHIIFLM